MLEKKLEQGQELEVHGHYHEAYNILTEGIQQGRDILAQLLNQRGIVSRMLEEYDHALNDFQDVLKTNPSDEQKALAYINIADIYRFAKKDYRSAHKYLDLAFYFIEKESLIHTKAEDQRGLIFVGEKNYPTAVEIYTKARRICEDLVQQDPEDKSVKNRLGQIIHHLGVAYYLLGNYDEASKSQNHALEIFNELGDKRGIINCKTHLNKINRSKTDT